ncbi:MAG: hypothetical protein KC931_00355, partial [Candidatus Omnitrophica bacterium]|nr:hypothetical protein [Candidatus Omnitrophota bacterium]
WVDVLRIHRNLAYLSISFEEDGRMLVVSRNHRDEIRIGDLAHNPDTGNLELREYLPGDAYPDHPYRVDPDRSHGDPRLRPWYIKAKQAGRPLWSDAYIFLGTGDNPNVPGVTYATPFYHEDGSFMGVMTADIDLLSLCGYFNEMRRSRDEQAVPQGPTSAVAFVMDGTKDSHVIAFHDIEQIMRKNPDDPSSWELIPGEELTETGLKGFYENVIEGDVQIPDEGPTEIDYTISGIAYTGLFQKLRGADMPNWLIGVTIEENEYMGRIHAILRETFLWGFLCLAAGIVVSVFVSRRISQPLQMLSMEAQAIGVGKLDEVEERRFPIREVDSLFRAKEEMKKGLRSFEKFVPRELVRELLASGREAELGGERAYLTVAFADIVNFTSISELMPPEEVVKMLSRFHGILYQSISETHGTIDKYIGDAVMSFWGAPVENPDHAFGACLAALHAQARLAEERKRIKDSSAPPIHCRIGINTGDLVVGNMGIPDRLSYTVIGDSVNLASRLEGLNRYYGTDIIVSENTYRAVSDRLIARKLDRVYVKGKTQGVFVYQLIGEKGKVEEKTLRDLQRYEEALEKYLERSWEDSVRILEDLQRDHPNDKSILLLLSRCCKFMEEAPDEDWDGSYRLG